ncbi:anti-sigma factor [Blastococcus sp. PRF04-17]|uniref:anti-sigma factor n=1 Tax=Blastococcus sp. PRF04-17 TaxID=2933797 RepID=UPI001FF6A037|nr:anti-sigma factor [Blastococcus sp. PRF04-17]UOY00396.1 anti-sigma factor [Blastococcus sp. PRF04-17]
MPHCTPEDLALAALREPLSADDDAHLASCDRCQAEVASLRRAVDVLAVPEFAAPAASVPPPPRVWEAIAAATGATSAPRADVLAVPPAPAGPDADDERPDATVVPLRRPRRPVLLAVAAAVAGAVVGAGVMAVLDRDEGGQPVTSVTLDPLADNEASGRAEIIEQADGSRIVRVDLDAPALEGEYYEVWLIDSDVVGMVTLGVARPGTQTFEIPAGLDLGRFPIVDVSVEELDGDPTHSGVSVARGELES